MNSIAVCSNIDRRKNLKSIIEALPDSGMPVVFPVHPRTEKFLQEYGLLERMLRNVRLIKPLGYLDRPCITLRENTEWMETLEGGFTV